MSERESYTRAIPYIKATLPLDSGEPVQTLSWADSPVLNDLQNGLVVAYVVDDGDALRFVQNGELQHHQIDVNTLHAIGVANLAELTSVADVRVLRCAGNVFGVLFDGNFEASLILLDSLWGDAFRQFVVGEYAVAIPARDMLAFGDGSSPEVIAQLRDICNRLEHADHQITDQLYLRTQGRWVPIPG